MSREGDYISLRDLSSSCYFHPVLQRNPSRRWNAQNGDGGDGPASQTHFTDLAGTCLLFLSALNEG